jgi:16S rRNA (cytosine1402-N4)-methyltransferase
VGDEGLTNTPEGVGRGGNHVPVLLKEAIDFLAIRRGGTYIDATVGFGGHSLEIAKRLSAPGHLIGFDKDPAALEIAQEKLSSIESKPEITLIHGSFAEISERCEANSADGILADLGVSSLQLDNAARGFSFQADGVLDMRMNTQSGRTAEQVVNHIDERELADVIYEFGEERRSRRIARAIVRSRPIRTTAQLAEIVSAATRSMKHERIHPATRTFQALRIFVNRELDDLRELVNAAPRILKPGGRLVIISFHSLEDRIVKDAMREGVKQGHYELLVKKPVTATEEEIDRNPRSRSAKMRAAKRI